MQREEGPKMILFKSLPQTFVLFLTPLFQNSEKCLQPKHTKFTCKINYHSEHCCLLGKKIFLPVKKAFI